MGFGGISKFKGSFFGGNNNDSDLNSASSTESKSARLRTSSDAGNPTGNKGSDQNAEERK